MRLFPLPSMLFCSFVTACNFSYKGDSNASLNGTVNQSSTRHFSIESQAGKNLSDTQLEQENFQLETGMITHGKFIFLEFAKEKQNQLHNYKDISGQYEYISNGTTVYNIQNTRLSLKYNEFVGRSVHTHNNRETTVLTIKDIVLISDIAYGIPYVAAELDGTVAHSLAGGWATTNKRLNPYPFTQLEDENLVTLAYAHLDSLNEYRLFKDLQQQTAEGIDYDYEESIAKIFEARPNEKYIFVSHSFIGGCGSIEKNYSALFHVTPGSWDCHAEGAIPEYFTDLIDVDGDQYPELLFHGFTSSYLYEITNKGFTEKISVQWSSDECPC